MPPAFDATTPRRIALVIHPERPAAHELARAARRWWEARGHLVLEDASYGGPDPRLLAEPLDLVVSLGGDGTMLRTVALALDGEAPVLGVNLGALGYLTEVEPGGLEGAFERLVAGDYEIEERMVLEVELEREPMQRYRALNDAVVEKRAQGHAIRFSLQIGGDPFLTYVADGFLVATPSGSTAYNFSLRGPIVSPRLGALILTPIAPHMLFDRSLVLDAGESLRIELLGERPAVLVIDGHASIELEPGEAIQVRAGKRPARLVSFGAAEVYGVLRQKFGLADR